MAAEHPEDDLVEVAEAPLDHGFEHAYEPAPENEHHDKENRLKPEFLRAVREALRDDDLERVYDLLPPRWRARDPALSTIGRLDKETSGLLLITDDGPLLHRVISPKAHVPKRYRAVLDRPLTGEEARA